MTLFRVSIGLTVLAAALGAVSVNADAHFLSGPLTGAITVFPLAGGVSNTAKLKIQGDGFHMAVVNADSGAVDALIACMPCVPGDEIDLSALFANDDLGEGLVTIGDERLKSAFLAGALTIRAGTVIVPDRGRLSVALSAPFTLEDGGQLQVFTSDFARVSREAGQAWAEGSVSGRGTATIVLTRLDLPDQIAYVVERIRYAFDDSVAENPEFPVQTSLIGLPSSSDLVTGR
jgi:hypothetical protein